jgi:hypothetical protein
VKRAIADVGGIGLHQHESRVLSLDDRNQMVGSHLAIVNEELFSGNHAAVETD